MTQIIRIYADFYLLQILKGWLTKRDGVVYICVNPAHPRHLCAKKTYKI